MRRGMKVGSPRVPFLLLAFPGDALRSDPGLRCRRWAGWRREKVMVPFRRPVEAGYQATNAQLLSCHRVSSPKAIARQLKSRKFLSILGALAGGWDQDTPPGGAFTRAIPTKGMAGDSILTV